MSLLLQFINLFLPNLSSQKALDEAYLCAAASTCDLERRLRVIDHRSHQTPLAMMHGLDRQ